jgi:hypothetical protein
MYSKTSAVRCISHYMFGRPKICIQCVLISSSPIWHVSSVSHPSPFPFSSPIHSSQLPSPSLLFSFPSLSLLLPYRRDDMGGGGQQHAVVTGSNVRELGGRPPTLLPQLRREVAAIQRRPSSPSLLQPCLLFCRSWRREGRWRQLW